MEFLIDKIAREPNFCVSSTEKVPLNVGRFLLSNNPNDISPVKQEDFGHLPTLNQINANHAFDNTNRAYYLHAKDNLVVGFDVEPRCAPEYLAYFIDIPAHYREWSMHNGIHVLYQLNRMRLSLPAAQMLNSRTEYKFKELVNNKPFEYELMMNHHWLTLTRNTKDMRQDNLMTPVPDEIYTLINNIAQDWSNMKYQQQIDISQNASDLAQSIADLVSDDNKDELESLTLDDFSDDDSRYEYNIAIRIAGILYRRLYQSPKPFDAAYLHCDPALVSENDFIWATALVLKQIVPERDKDNELRDGVPWLVYTAKAACQYILANN